MSPDVHSPVTARREFLGQTGLGLGLGRVALGWLLQQDRLLASPVGDASPNPLAPRSPMFPARANAIIQLFMAGGPSQLELFDYKPKLQQLNGQTVPPSFVEGKRFAFISNDAKCLGTTRAFKQYGECGAEVSELLPRTAEIVDNISFVRTMHTDNFNHGPAKLITQTGTTLFGRPSLGAWTVYGLGCESRDLPGYVVLHSGPRGPRGGSYLYSSGFLSSVYQGVPLRSQGDPILNLNNPAGVSRDRQGRVLRTINRLNKRRHEVTGDAEIEARIANYEMAYRMQASAPELIDLTQETADTLAMYGATPGEASFANNCLLARRLVERGVRFVTLFHTNWDHHGGPEGLEGHGPQSLEAACSAVDRPTAALVKDLKQRGMWDETLVLWGGEFGRTPMGEQRKPPGRDHHIDAYTVWLGGGGVRPGHSMGTTDELGFYPTDPDRAVHVHDLQATLLHLLGMDHLKLTYRFQGRDFRITDVGGKVVHELLSDSSGSG